MPKKTTTIRLPRVKSRLTGKTTFRGGVHRTRKDRMRNRRDKFAQRQKRDQLSGG